MGAEKLELLVIEDNPKHLQDAKAEMQKRIDSHIPLSVDFAGTLEEAMKYVSEKRYDGIITDIFFPAETSDKSKSMTRSTYGLKGWNQKIAIECRKVLEKYGITDSSLDLEACQAFNKWMSGEEMHPAGIVVTEYTKEKGIPLVFCTDTWHHGYKTSPICDYAGMHRIPVIEAYPQPEKPEGELSEEEMDDYEELCAYFPYKGEAKTKDWTDAYQSLILQITKARLLESHCTDQEEYNRKFNMFVYCFALLSDDKLRLKPSGKDVK